MYIAKSACTSWCGYYASVKPTTRSSSALAAATCITALKMSATAYSVRGKRKSSHKYLSFSTIVLEYSSTATFWVPGNTGCKVHGFTWFNAEGFTGCHVEGSEMSFNIDIIKAIIDLFNYP